MENNLFFAGYRFLRLLSLMNMYVDLQMAVKAGFDHILLLPE
jgi:hypothetical protein